MIMDKQNKNKLIAVTGGIGSGKSMVLSILSRLGFSTISCDKITAELYTRQTVLRHIKNIFPSAVSGKIKLVADKTEISRLVFTNPNLHKQLTEYLAELTFSVALKRAKRLKGKVFIEVPLLFECNKQDCFDKIIVVQRNIDDRINSVITRSKLTKEQVLQRIANQFDYKTLPKNAIVIQNNGSVEDLGLTLLTITRNI